MTNSDRYIVELSRAAIFDDIPAEPYDDIDWTYIYDKSDEQNMLSLIFTAVNKLPEDKRPEEELYNKWRKRSFRKIAFAGKQFNEFRSMSKKIFDENIKIVGLKGIHIRSFYPTPEIRTMADYDILAKENDLERIEEIFNENGYEVKKDIYGIVAGKENSYWEIFTQLKEEFATDSEVYTDMIYDNSQVCGSMYIPEPTLFLAHIIIHTGKHYIEKGAGLRNLCDIALYLKKNEDNIDFEKLEKLCREQNFYNIYTYIMCAVGKYYGVESARAKEEKYDSEKFIEYTLSNGVFGKMDNVLVHQMAKPEDDKISGKRKLFFPSAKTLDYRYTYLKKYPFLLPIAWIHRFFSGVFCRGFSVFSMVRDLKEAEKFSDERLKQLDELGIKEKH
ncbi:MAG: nucleotidyltransferase family protein [Firmicutes bacterium]|nr:nucleotidyltransferase family protein [Bacillota bacterium]